MLRVMKSVTYTIYLVFLLILVGCGQDYNKDPHRRGRGNTNFNENLYAPSISGGSVYCNSSIVGKLIDGPHSHTISLNSLSLSQVQMEQAGVYSLLTGAHQHTFSISSGEMGMLKRKKEIIIQDNQSHYHNLNLSCL